MLLGLYVVLFLMVYAWIESEENTILYIRRAPVVVCNGALETRHTPCIPVCNPPPPLRSFSTYVHLSKPRGISRLYGVRRHRLFLCCMTMHSEYLDCHAAATPYYCNLEATRAPLRHCAMQSRQTKGQAVSVGLRNASGIWNRSYCLYKSRDRLFM